MKKLFLMLMLVSAAMLINTAKAQVRLEVNIGAQPIWGPVGYDHADYYYLPDINAYYYIPQRQFVYMEGGNWVFGAALPPRYGNFDLYHAYKVVINDPKPYLHNDIYMHKYAMYKGHHDQVAIRDSREPKYFVNKDHPMHAQYHGEEHHEERHEEHHEEHH